LAGASSKTEIVHSQQERKHMIVHCNAATAATKHMTHDAHLKIIHKTGSGKNKNQHAVGCKYIHIEANAGQSTI
jgi:hypothetical protein